MWKILLTPAVLQIKSTNFDQKGTFLKNNGTNVVLTSFCSVSLFIRYINKNKQIIDHSSKDRIP